MHVDTGGVRHWPRLPRQELAILFPSGNSKHVPTDGRPLTKKDFQIALANLQSKGGELPIAVQRRLQGGGEGRTILASAKPEDKAPAAPREQAPPKMVFASLTPFNGLSSAKPDRREEFARRTEDDDEPLVKTNVQPGPRAEKSAGLRPDFAPDTNSRPSALVPEDQIASAPDYDDDHPDELDYAPFPILPFMAETPIAEMDLSPSAPGLDLRKVHMLFGESAADAGQRIRTWPAIRKALLGAEFPRRGDQQLDQAAGSPGRRGAGPDGAEIASQPSGVANQKARLVAALFCGPDPGAPQRRQPDAPPVKTPAAGDHPKRMHIGG